MKIKWWPWGLLTAISLILLLFFVLYPLGVLFANSVTGPDGGYTLQGFRALLADSQYLEAFGNTLILAWPSPPAPCWWACPSPTWWRATTSR